MRRITARLLALSLAATGLIAAPAAADHGDGPCPVHTIEEVQGTGDVTPFDGDHVEVTGIVTRVAGGDFYLEEVHVDDDPAASNAIFVDDFSADVPIPAVATGDVVTVCGEAGERYDRTRLFDVQSIEIVGSDEVPLTTFSLPAPQVLEAYENMHLRIDQRLYFSDIYNSLSFGEAGVSGDGALRIPTDLYEPSSADQQALEDENSRNLLEIFLDRDLYDDLRTSHNRFLRWGDAVDVSATGTIYENFGDHTFFTFDRSRYFGADDVTLLNDRPSDAPDIGDADVVVASFNVFNYWTSDYDGEYRDCVATATGGDPYDDDNVDAAVEECGPEPRGHRGETQKANQRAAITAAITAMDADVVALQELETPGLGERNAGDDPNETLIDLVQTLNDAAGAETWAYVPVGDDFSSNTNPIHSGFIYRPDRVTSDDDMLVLTDLVDVYDRLPVAATFSADGQTLTVVNNHWKSKGCFGDDSGADSDQGDGQACWNATRTMQAEAVAAWVDELRTSEGTDQILVVGDLNAYGQEDPVVALREGGLKDLATRWLRGWDTYSYTFFGQAGQLDHAFATRSLAMHITGVDIWHVNAAESNGLSYFGAKPSKDVWRSSDHDPVVVGIDFDARPGRGRR